jgi:hypothetical protein
VGLLDVYGYNYGYASEASDKAMEAGIIQIGLKKEMDKIQVGAIENINNYIRRLKIQDEIVICGLLYQITIKQDIIIPIDPNRLLRINKSKAEMTWFF